MPYISEDYKKKPITDELIELKKNEEKQGYVRFLTYNNRGVQNVFYVDKAWILSDLIKSLSLDVFAISSAYCPEGTFEYVRNSKVINYSDTIGNIVLNLTSPSINV